MLDSERAVIFEDHSGWRLKQVKRGQFHLVIGIDRVGQSEDLKKHGA